MLASDDKRFRALRTYEYPSSLPISSNSKTLSTPKRPAKEVIGQIHRRLSSSSTIDSPNGKASSIPLRVPSGIKMNNTGGNYGTLATPESQLQQPQRPPPPTQTQSMGYMAPTAQNQGVVPRQPKPRPLQLESEHSKRLSYTTGHEPFVNRKSLRKSVIYPDSSMDQPPPPPSIPLPQQHAQNSLQRPSLPPLQVPPRKPYQYNQVPSSPVAPAPARPLSFSRPRSARASVSPPVEPTQESIPPVPPLPEQVTLGKYRQVRNFRSVSNEVADTLVPYSTAPRRRSHHPSMDAPKHNNTSNFLRMPKSQTTNDLSSFAFQQHQQYPQRTQKHQYHHHHHNASPQQSQQGQPTVTSKFQLVQSASSSQLASKSPHRPVNRPALLHPQGDKPATPDLPPQPPLTTRLRSKSTAPKQWMTPPKMPSLPQGLNGAARSGQTSVSATRRMFSPFKRSNEESKPMIPAPSMAPSRSSPESSDRELDETNDNEREIREIMQKLVTSKPDDSISRKRLEDFKKHGQPAQQAMSPAYATKNYRLNLYEKGEILDFRKIYFCGRQDAKKVSGDIRRSASNYGFDDDKGDYKVVSGDHIAYRYEILGVLGKGSFGKVVKCIDHKTGQLAAVKLIINRKRFHMQALVEADILKTLSTWDSKDKHHLIRYIEHFNFRDHLCISTELLGINLYELIKYNQYKGLPHALVKHFTKQLLDGLKFLETKTVIHCDLKPENVLLCDPERGKVKIIDFGSSCYESERVYTYIQSRFYRSPEVMLGMTYSEQIDVWSLGCIIAELLTGKPLFMGENEQEQVACIMEIFGVPDKAMISKCSRRKLFFDSMGNPRMKTKEKKYPNSKSLRQELKTKDQLLVEFLSSFLIWNPKTRTTPSQALKHEWITGYPDVPPIPAHQSPVRRSPLQQTPSPAPSQMSTHQLQNTSQPQPQPQPPPPPPPPPSVGIQPSHTPPNLTMTHNMALKASPRQMQQRATPGGRREYKWR